METTITQKQKTVGFAGLKQLCKVYFACIFFFPFLASAQTTGPSTTQSPYLVPVASGVGFTSILSANDSINGYPMVGVPDGLGIFDNGDGTFTLISNHELLNTQGRVRAHGSKGAFVSKWNIKKSDFTVLSGSDLMQNVNLWNGTAYDTYNAGNPSPLAAFSRFCSADLPPVSAFYNSNTGLGTQERIYMNGEEVGEGRAMAHIVTGVNAGTSYQLPLQGKMSFENQVASGNPSDKTIVACLDDASITTSNVYFYVGTKTNTGTEIDKAGLTNGKLYGVKISGFPQERINSTSINNPPVPGTHFDLVDLGAIQNLTGAQLDAASAAAGTTYFSRSEDGAWDPSNPRAFYFNTTDQIDQVNDGVGTQVGRSRLWRLRFDDIQHPESGGTVEAVLDGTEGQVMLDNMAIDHYGHIVLLEDVGNSAHNGKMWLYDIATDQLTQIAKHDPARFGDIGVAATSPFNQDEETSGVIDAHEVLGAGMFLFDDQAHYTTGIPLDIVEGGQYLAMHIAGLCSVPAQPGVIKGEKFDICTAGNYAFHVRDVDGVTSYTWTVPESFTVVSTSALGDSITLAIPAGIETEQLQVIANNSCGSSEPRIAHIHGKPSIPEINGPDCVSANELALVYTITNADPGFTYTWKVPNGATITSGQGTSQVKVNWKASSGTITVTASNGCGTSGKAHFAVSVGCERNITKTSLSTQSNFSIIAFPNPANGIVNVQFNAETANKYILEVYDINSKMIQRKEIIALAGKNSLVLDLSRVPKGNYLIKVTNGTHSATQKIVITQ